MTETEKSLKQVTRSAKLADRSTAALHQAIANAAATGASLRAIAAASGLNHETVRTIIRAAA